MSKSKPVTLVHIVTVPLSLSFFHGSIGALQARNMAVHIICSPGELADTFAAAENVPVHTVAITRRITPLKDLRALWQLWCLLRQIKPQIVHVHTPKASLLGGLAAWLARVPVRIYQIHGFRHETTTGFKRWLLLGFEWVKCLVAHQVWCVSQSLAEQTLAEDITNPRKINVIHQGSINGIDAQNAFNPALLPDARTQIRHLYNIPTQACVIGFVGRVVHDKGLVELVSAWQSLKQQYADLHVLVVGNYETGDPLPQAIKDTLEADERIHLTKKFVGKADVATYFAAFDILAFPTYREGFGLVAAEASAMTLPVVATRVTGCVDAVVDGVTGTLVPVRDATALADALQQYIDNPDLRRQHGLAGRERMLRDFRPEDIWATVYEEYNRLLAAANRRTLYLDSGKRVFDLLVTIPALVLLSPVLLLVAGLVRWQHGSPIFFCQPRPGRDGNPFLIYKFRTMTNDRDNHGKLLPDAERLTALGKFLRKTSLDELPELLNVLRGEMSLVGPRPLLMQYLDRYTPEQARRHEVRPGITGWAQINGRNSLSWEEKFTLDVWYVDHMSWRLDLKILALTVGKVLKREGINQQGQATMTKFTGSSTEGGI